MKCEKCGHNLPDDSKFCQYCGSSIAEDAANATSKLKKAQDNLRELDLAIEENKRALQSAFTKEQIREFVARGQFTEQQAAEYEENRRSSEFFINNELIMRKNALAMVKEAQAELDEFELKHHMEIRSDAAKRESNNNTVSVSQKELDKFIVEELAENEDNCSEKSSSAEFQISDSKQRSKTNPIWPILLVVLSIFSVALYITSLNLREEVDNLKETNTSLGLEIKDLKGEIASLEKKAKENTATKTINGARDFISSSKANSYKASSKYYANTNVVVVEVGKTATLSVTCTLDDDLWLEWSNSNAEAEWHDDWSYNTCTVSVKGKKAGTTVISFTAENSSKAFDILVIVV